MSSVYTWFYRIITSFWFIEGTENLSALEEGCVASGNSCIECLLGFQNSYLSNGNRGGLYYLYDIF